MRIPSNYPYKRKDMKTRRITEMMGFSMDEKIQACKEYGIPIFKDNHGAKVIEVMNWDRLGAALVDKVRPCKVATPFDTLVAILKDAAKELREQGHEVFIKIIKNEEIII